MSRRLRLALLTALAALIVGGLSCVIPHDSASIDCMPGMVMPNC